MPRMRPTESSWDSDEDLLKDDDSISLNVYPSGKDLEEMDEDALLAGSDDETSCTGTNQINVSQSLSHPEFDVNEEELIELEVEDPDYLEESAEIDNRTVNAFLEREAEESTATEQLEVTLSTTDDVSQLGTSVAAAGYERAVASSDEDSDEDKEDNEDSRHRARFRSERPDAQRTMSSSQPKTDIPDTLELSKEQQEQVEEFMQQRPWPKGRGSHARARRFPNNMTASGAPLLHQPMRPGVVGLFPRGGAGGTMKNRFPLGNQTPMMAIGRPGQMFGAGDGFLGATSVDTQRHKILINPHFRGSGHTQLESQGPWTSSQNSSHSLPFQQQQQQQQMMRMTEAPSQPLQPTLAPFRPLMSVDLTQRRPLLPQLLAVQRAPINQPRPFLGVPQSFTSQPHTPAQLQFQQQQQTGIRPNFVAQRRPVTMFYGSSFQQPPLVPSSPSQHLQQPPQFIPRQQMQTLTQTQSPIVHNLQSSQQINFTSQVQSQIVNNAPRPNIQPSNFAPQQQTSLLNQSFSGPIMQEFGIEQPQLNRIIQPLPGPFIQQTTPPRIQPPISVASHLHGVPFAPGAGDVPSLLQGFAGGVHLQRMPQMEEIGQPIETVVHRKVQSRGGLAPAPAQPSFSGLPKLSPGTRFTANRLSVFGGRRQRQMTQLQSPKPIRIATIQPSVIHAEPTEEQDSADREQMQKLEDRARRFAQPPPALVAKPALKRPSDVLNDPMAPAAKQAKLLASRKALAKAAFLKKRRELLAAHQRRLQLQQQQQQQQSSLSLDRKPESQLIDKDHDAELQRGLEQQKLLREEFLRKKEQRRLQQASLRRKELEQRFRAEGLTDDQIKAKFDSDSNRELKSTSDAVQSTATALTATVSVQNPGAAKPTVAAAVGKKPTKTIVMTKSQYEAMVRSMKGTDFGGLGKMPTGIAGRTRPNLPIGQEQRLPGSSSQRTGAFAVASAPRSTGPQFQPRGKFASMARSQKVAPVPLRAATNASTLAPRLGDSGARQRAVGSFVWQSRHVVRPTIRQNVSAIASANQNRRVVFGAGDRSLLSSSVVAIEGLALSTTAQALVQLAQKVGPVQHVQLMSSERKALLRFHNAEHATLFARGYNRHMLDLSMINVTVVPP